MSKNGYGIVEDRLADLRQAEMLNSDARATRARQRRLAQPSLRVIGDIFAVIDFFLIVAMAMAAQAIYLASYLLSTQSSTQYLAVGAVGGIIMVAYSRSQDAYSFERLSVMRGQSRRLIVGLGVTAFVLLGVGYLLKASSDYSRGWMIAWFALSFAALILNRFLASSVLRRWATFGIFARNVAVYGSDEIARDVIEHLGTMPERVRVVGVFDDLVPGATPRVIASGGLAQLLALGQSGGIDEVLVAMSLSDDVKIARLVKELSILPVDIRLCPDRLAFTMRPRGLVDYNGVAAIELARRPLGDWDPIVKMVEDRLLAGLMLLAAMPFMLMVACAIKLDSPGPVFFRQKRHGFNHKIISVWKFRTMTVTEDGAHVAQAQKNDPRVTRVGKWLRRTSIDELPQLINVLGGSMSLVGPRPHAIAHNEYFASLLGVYASRHKVKPGITGWAQVNGFRGETDTPEKMRQRVECDLYYIENWSLWLDIKILLLTPYFGLFSKNAF
jgi:putative colanic acid biosynthesis UDP-glucose lipid carrier transferase